MNIVLLHPGQMGVTIGQALIRSGHEVRWVAQGRSQQTRQRAHRSGFTETAELIEAFDGADAVVSVCPPSEAQSVMDQVLGCGYQGLYLDANAVAPETAQAMARKLGDRYIDGGIIGPPAQTAGSTRLYLSGSGADAALKWFDDDILGVVTIGSDASAASSLKMCYAAYTKGSSALLLAVRALACSLNVEDALLNEWSLSQAGLETRAKATARGTAAKAWRFSGEMAEIATTFAGAGLPNGFHLAAREIYDRMGPLKDSADADLELVMNAILQTPGTADS